MAGVRDGEALPDTEFGRDEDDTPREKHPIFDETGEEDIRRGVWAGAHLWGKVRDRASSMKDIDGLPAGYVRRFLSVEINCIAGYTVAVANNRAWTLEERDKFVKLATAVLTVVGNVVAEYESTVRDDGPLPQKLADMVKAAAFKLEREGYEIIGRKILETAEKEFGPKMRSELRESYNEHDRASAEGRAR
jgi:hypothetical protein